MNSFNDYFNYNESLLGSMKSTFQRLWKMVREQSFSDLSDGWKKFKEFIINNNLEEDVTQIFNKHLKTNFQSLNSIPDPDPKILMEEMVYEDWKHFWQKIKTELFPTLSFWPALQIWLEIDKVIKEGGFIKQNVIVIAVYGIFWVTLISMKYLKEWYDWKKKNPEEYEQEKNGMKE